MSTQRAAAWMTLAHRPQRPEPQHRAWGRAALICGLLCVSCSSLPNSSPTASAPFETTPQPTQTPTGSSSATATGNPRGVALPNRSLTPGEAFAGVTAAEVCTSGWSSSHRNVTAEQYHEVYGAYGIAYPEPSGTYELDHLIPLELGGDNANANLWPEPASPAPGFHQKDDLENAMHALVCAGTLTLGEAQHEIATNWYAAYVEYVRG